MERAKELELLSECIALAQAKRRFAEGDETLVPVSRYIDDDRFEREQQVLFRTLPNLVAHSSQVSQPGDFITREIAAMPAIVVRASDGRVNAFVNVCRHRGATVEPRRQGHCTRFVCPYHAWTYGLNGQLDRVRHQDGFPTLDIAATSLVRLPVFEAAGFIWVVPDASVEPEFEAALPSVLLDELGGLGCESLEVFDSAVRIWNANWKLIVDGGLESYHFKVVHRNTIAAAFLDNSSTFELIGDHIRSVLPRTSLLGLAEEPHSTWDIRKHTNVLYSLFPNASVLIQEDHVVLVLMAPLTVDMTRIEVISLVPASANSSERATRHWQSNHALTVTTLNEDFEIAEQIQRGATTGANEHYRLARFEAALSKWHERIDAKLDRA